MNIKNIICLLLPCLLQACTNELLSEQSVVDAGAVQNPQTELDHWIADSITAPYNIEVVYRWQKNANTGTTFGRSRTMFRNISTRKPRRCRLSTR